MSTPISGTAGSLKIGASTSIAWAGKWTFKGSRKTTTIGPHIGDANEYEIGNALSGEFSIDGTIPSGGDAGQDLIISNFTANTSAAIALEATLGKTITFAAPVFDSLEIELDAKGTHTFKASGKGTFTIAQDT